jgi:hypothetical protein
VAQANGKRTTTPRGGPTRIVTLEDILDLRAYERVRDDYRRRVIELKRARRVPLGPIMTVVFESFDTVRFQVQEMARAERILSDGNIQAELDVYNRLLPAPGELSATLFIELTTEDELREWLPKLVGVERALGVDVPGARPSVAAGTPEETHAEALTRETVTAAVHYLRFGFTEDQVGRFGAGSPALVARHDHYEARTELSAEARAALLGDLEGRTEPLALG